MPQILTSKLDRIDQNSRLPKYRQVINTILCDINQELFKPGDRIPSINETSEEYYLSRDTVEKAYKELSRRGIITSIPGKGYYVNANSELAKLKVLVAVDELSDTKKVLYQSFVKTLGKYASVTLHVHHGQFKCFEHLLLDHLGEYDHYVVMPHFREPASKVMEVLRKIPRNKLLVLDRMVPGLPDNTSAVYQRFSQDIYEALHSGASLLEKYRKFYLVAPADSSYPEEIQAGFTTFCQSTKLPYEIVPHLQGHDVQAGSAYFTLNQRDLLHLIKTSRNQGLTPGQELGVLAYGDTPVNEVLAGGITALTTDQQRMGQTAADMILNKRRIQVHNPFYLVERHSL
ncbi:GntR family transcriptional regulator [Pontibacter sp. G13]|uniref:GntR family transcriptional regulator n=1 Tax=Pontibacter sp. G13 TaxID=3074898 RepID=UPI00288A718A|nr:GntR family transcriptional regulator [Pontibacter sp. G13]WNJ21611.1 GntR family transcriptional regulator [Pontibacter sp. G13]